VRKQLEELENEKRIRWIFLPIPNLPLARNIGLHNSEGNIILYCDDDIIVRPNFIAAHASRYTNPDVAAVAGRIVTPSYSSSKSFSFSNQDADSSEYGTYDRPLPGRLSPDGNNESHFDQTGYQGDVEWGQGCNMSFRRSVLLEAGGFDERYTGTAIHEEVDTFTRVRALSYRAVFEPKAWMIHLKHSGGGCRHQREEIDRLCSTYKNKSLFFWKTSGIMGWLRYTRFQLRAMYSAIRIHSYPAATFLRFISSHLAGVHTAVIDSPDGLSRKL
jgi:GT2 family glycosyltransferase